MTRARIVGLALAAMFAITAIAASAASAALPEFLPAGGKFPVKFTSTSGTGILETVGGTKITCTSDTNTGELTGAKTDVVTVTFKGCTGPLGVKCNSTSPKGGSGEIITKTLASTLGYINEAKKEVGILLAPKEGEFFVEFECTGFAVSKVKGSVIGKIEPINTKTNKFTLTFTQSKGKQSITKFGSGEEEVLLSSLNGGEFEQAGEETTDTLTLAEEGTIDA